MLGEFIQELWITFITKFENLHKIWYNYWCKHLIGTHRHLKEDTNMNKKNTNQKEKYIIAKGVANDYVWDGVDPMPNKISETIQYAESQGYVPIGEVVTDPDWPEFRLQMMKLSK